MTITDDMVERAARSDSSFDGRTFDALGTADKKRYLARSRASLAAAYGWRAMDSAPKDGTDILVYYDHDADPYQDPHNPARLTDYAAWAEGGDFMGGKGWCIAAWQGRHWESTDEYGDGYWMPAYWFARQNDDYEAVVNPIAWSPLTVPTCGVA